MLITTIILKTSQYTSVYLPTRTRIHNDYLDILSRIPVMYIELPNNCDNSKETEMTTK